MSILCMVLLSNDRPFDAQAFARQFRGDWPDAGTVGEVSVSECVTTIDIGEYAVMVAQMPVPIPQFSVPDNRLYLMWPEAKNDVPRHQRHWIVTLTGPDNSVLDRARMLTKAVRSLLVTHPFALGITWGSEANLVSRERFEQVATDLRTGDDPFLLWVDVQCGWRPEGAASGRSVGLTRGLKDFDLMDFETLDARESPSDLYSRLVGLIGYVLTSGPVIRDGDTIGQDANEKIRVVYAPSSFGLDARVMRLEYAAPTSSMSGYGAGYGGYPATPNAPNVLPPAPANPWSAGVPSDHPAATVTWTPTSDPYANSSSLSPLAAFSIILAVVAPFLSCFCFLHVPAVLISLVLGHLAVYQIGRSNGRQYGQGIAITALVIDYLLLLGTLAFAGYLFVYAPLQAQRNAAPRTAPVELDESPDQSSDSSPDNAPDIPLDQSPAPGPSLTPEPAPGNSGFVPSVQPVPPPFVPDSAPPVTPPGSPSTDPSTDPSTISPPKKSSSSSPSTTRPDAGSPEIDSATVKLRVPDLGWSVMSLAFSRDGRRLALGKLDSSFVVYDVETGDQILKRERLTKLGQISAVAFAPTGDELYVGGWSGAIEAFSLSDPSAASKSMVAQSRNVRCMEVSPDGRFVISGADDGHVLWQVPGEPTKVRTLKALDSHVLAVKLAAPPVTAWATDGKTVATINLREARVTKTDTLTKNYVHAAAFSPDGKQVSASLGSSVAVWNVGTPEPVARLSMRNAMQWSVQFTPDGRYLLCGSQGQVAVWDVASRTSVAEYKLASPLYVKTLATSPDSRFVAAVPEAAGQTLFVFKLPAPQTGD